MTLELKNICPDCLGKGWNVQAKTGSVFDCKTCKGTGKVKQSMKIVIDIEKVAEWLWTNRPEESQLGRSWENGQSHMKTKCRKDATALAEAGIIKVVGK